MSIRARWTTNPRTGGITTKCHIGRMSSLHLQKIGELSSATAAQTALSGIDGKTTNVLVTCTLAGVTQSALVADLESNPARNVVVFEWDGLLSGDYEYTFTTDSHNSIRQIVNGIAKIWRLNSLRVATISCMQPARADGSFDGVDVDSGDARDNFPSAPVGAQPGNGEWGQTARQIANDNFDGFLITDDVTYINKPINKKNTEANSCWWMPPASLTDTINDDPVSLDAVNSYATHIAGLSFDYSSSLENQNLYIRYEALMSRPEMFALTGRLWCQFIYGDHEFPHNNFDHAWWSINDADGVPDSAKMAFGVQPSDAVQTNLNYNPLADANNIQLVDETVDVFAKCRAVFDLFCGANENVLLAGLISSPPWLVRNYATAFNAADYIPLTLHIDHPVCSIIMPDFMTCADLNRVPNHTLLDVAVGAAVYAGGRAIESPLGDNNDATIRAVILSAINAKTNLYIASPKQLGATDGGNTDGLILRCPAWLDSFISFLVSLTYSVAVSGGDRHSPSGYLLDDDIVSLTPSPLTFHGFDTAAPKDILPSYGSAITIYPDWYDGTSVYNSRRSCFASYYAKSNVAYISGKDHRGGYFAPTFELNVNKIKSINEIGLTIPKVTKMAKTILRNIKIGVSGGVGIGVLTNGNIANTDRLSGRMPLQIFGEYGDVLISIGGVHENTLNKWTQPVFNISQSAVFADVAIDVAAEAAAGIAIGDTVTPITAQQFADRFPSGFSMQFSPTPVSYVYNAASLSGQCHIPYNFNDDVFANDDQIQFRPINNAAAGFANLKETITAIHAGADSATILTSVGAFAGENYVGYRVKNATDHSYATIIANDDDTITVDALIGEIKSDLMWQAGDVCLVPIFDLEINVDDPSSAGAGGESDAVIADAGNLELNLPAGVYSLASTDATVQSWAAGFTATEAGQSDPIVTSDLPAVLSVSGEPILVRREAIDSNGNVAVLTRAVILNTKPLTGVTQTSRYTQQNGQWVNS